MGVHIATRPTWAFQFLQKAVASGGSKHLLSFPINRGRKEEQKCSTLLVFEIHLKLVRKIVSVKKIQAEALP